MEKTLLWVAGVCLVVLTAIAIGNLQAHAVYLLRALIPSSVAIKIVQGLAVVHEIKATNLDYRYKRQLTAFGTSAGTSRLWCPSTHVPFR